MHPARNQTSQYPSLTIDCVQPVTERLSTPHWQSIVSTQWPSVSVPALWQSAVSNQWQNVSVSLSDDRLCPVSDQTSQCPSLTVCCVQPVTKRLNTPSLTIYCVKSVTKHLRTPSLTIDCLQPVTKLLSSPSLTMYCVQSVAKRLSIPLWWSTVAIFYWFSTDCPLEPSLYL